jgi:hypothetical protein
MQVIRLALLLLFSATVAAAQTSHSVKITWTDTVNPAGTTYNVYKANTNCTGTPTFVKLNTAPITTQSYTDTNVAAGTYCYSATAVGPGGESAQSNTGSANVLAPPSVITITVTVQ